MDNNNKPLRVWLTIDQLGKTTGGPAVVVQNLAEQLADLGAAVTVVTHASSNGQSEVLPRGDRVLLIRIPRTHSFLGFKRTLMQRFKADGGDLLHDFGVWLPSNHGAATAARAMRVPFVCSPCGILAPWALCHKAWKKKIAWWLYQRHDLLRARSFVASSKPEVEHIQQIFPGKPVALVPNGVELPPLLRSALRVPHSALRTILFLGRVHPVKGLLNLVEAWARVRPQSWRCIIAGPDEAGHRAELEAALRQHGIADDFTFAGLVEGDDKWCLLQAADLFVLPSFSESFSIAIAEALAAGVPVISTKGTPWEELVSRRCGWWIDIGAEPLAATLREAMALTVEQRREMGQRGRRLVEGHYAWPKIGQDMKMVYEWLLGGGAKPACVV
jgi:glycosyltransferase involved in cell wall biosynthesis